MTSKLNAKKDRKLIVRTAKKDEEQKIKNLWVHNFKEDSIQYVHYYFKNMYDRKYTYILEDKKTKELLCTLQLRPKTIMHNNHPTKTFLIVAVVTPVQHRKKGYMKILLESVLKKLDKKNEFTLIQAYNWDLYKTFGYKTSHKMSNWVIDTTKMIECCILVDYNCESLLDLYETMTEKIDGYQVRDISYYKQKLELSKIEKTEIISTNRAYIEVFNNNIVDYGFVEIEDLFGVIGHLRGTVQVKMPEFLKPNKSFVKVEETQIFMMKRDRKNMNIKFKKPFINEYI